MAYFGDLVLDTAPAAEPISTAEAKTQARIDISDDDTYVDTLVASARSYVENITGRQIITATYNLYLPYFPEKIILPKPPLSAVNSINYIDENGNSQLLSSSIYTVNANRTPGEIVPAYEQSWPSTRGVPNAVTVNFDCGYGSAGSDVPEDLVHAMKLLISLHYDDRSGEAEVPRAVRQLTSNYDIRGYR